MMANRKIKQKKKNPTKIPDILDSIHKAIDSGEYIDVTHAQLRKKERKITRAEYKYVLLNGWHEASKDKFNEEFKAWNYSIRGETLDKRKLRVIISFDSDGMLIITVIELEA